jgi:hypothetical protein
MKRTGYPLRLVGNGCVVKNDVTQAGADATSLAHDLVTLPASWARPCGCLRAVRASDAPPAARCVVTVRQLQCQADT